MLARELQAVLGNMKQDFDRVEILAAALAAFNRPIPDYEPTFRHLGQAALRDHDLDSAAGETGDSL